MGNRETVDIPALRAVHLGLYPTLDSLESVVDLGLSQLPINSPNALVSVLMTYHNTMIRLQKESKHEEAPRVAIADGNSRLD